MKKGIVIVNTARGAVIDEAALVKALDNGTVWSCGLDVYEAEPEIQQGLIANPQVMLLPHMGTWTVEVRLTSEYCIDKRANPRIDTDRHGRMQYWQCACCTANGQAYEYCARAERHVITVFCDSTLLSTFGFPLLRSLPQEPVAPSIEI